VRRGGLNEDAPAFNAAVLDYIKKAADNELSLVIIAAAWEYYLEKESTQNGPFRQALRQTVQKIQAAGCQVVILIDVPKFPFDPPRSLALRALRGESSSNLVINSAQFLADTALQRPILTELSLHGVTIIDPAEFFTDSSGIIRPADNISSFYMDRNHLSSHGSMRLLATFRTILQPGS